MVGDISCEDWEGESHEGSWNVPGGNGSGNEYVPHLLSLGFMRTTETDLKQICAHCSNHA